MSILVIAFFNTIICLQLGYFWILVIPLPLFVSYYIVASKNLNLGSVWIEFILLKLKIENTVEK